MLSQGQLAGGEGKEDEYLGLLLRHIFNDPGGPQPIKGHCAFVEGGEEALEKFKALIRALNKEHSGVPEADLLDTNEEGGRVIVPRLGRSTILEIHQASTVFDVSDIEIPGRTWERYDMLDREHTGFYRGPDTSFYWEWYPKDQDFEMVGGRLEIVGSMSPAFAHQLPKDLCV